MRVGPVATGVRGIGVATGVRRVGVGVPDPVVGAAAITIVELWLVVLPRMSLARGRDGVGAGRGIHVRHRLIGRRRAVTEAPVRGEDRRPGIQRGDRKVDGDANRPARRDHQPVQRWPSGVVDHRPHRESGAAEQRGEDIDVAGRIHEGDAAIIVSDRR